MKTKILRVILPSLLFFAGALNSEARIDSELDLDLKCYFQNSLVVTNSRETGQLATGRVNSKDLMRLIGQQSGVSFRNGSKLKMATDGKVYVETPDGSVRTDVSQYVMGYPETADQAIDGSYYFDSNRENRRYFYRIQIQINIGNLQGVVSGLTEESINASPPNRYDVQIVKSSGKSVVNGKGLFQGKLAYFDGKLTLKGSQAVVGN